MKKFKFMLLLVALLFGFHAEAPAQMMQPLPTDPGVRMGRLENGLTYYIRHNALPEKRVNFYIAQKVGSVQEEDSQRGLAHFLEHMCFNGTTNFPGNSIVSYCERIGVKFGQDLNAYTSTDETVYRISNVPVSESNTDSCLLILHDWADGLLLQDAEIDKERGVIHEEWRMRSSAMMRMYEKLLPEIYPGSRYGQRLPIGTMEVIDNFKYKELRDYYERWYRPDLQGIVVVGDIDVDAVEAKIKAIFSPIKMPENAEPYVHYPVPDNAEPIYAIATDKEQATGTIALIFKQDALPEELAASMGKILMDMSTSVVTSVLNERLNELANKPGCPFIAAQADYSNFILSKTKDCFMVYVVPKAGQDTAAVHAVMVEVERAARHGFTPSELQRAKDKYVNAVEQLYDNREKQEHDFFAQRCIRHFLQSYAMPDLSTQFQMTKMLAQQIPADMYSMIMKDYAAHVDSNFICMAMYPEKEGVAVPTAADLRQAVERAAAEDIQAYVDNTKNEPLVARLPKPGKIKGERQADFGYTEWTLANGARVYFKKTDFDDSKVLFSAVSRGGRSLTSVADSASIAIYDQAMDAVGLGGFTSTELSKALAGKRVSLHASLGETSETLEGASTPKDLRTLFELIHLQFAPAMDDSDAYNAFIEATKVSLQQAAEQPVMVWLDTVRNVISNYHPGAVRASLANIDKASYATIRRIHDERFNAGGDFDYFFTGAIDTDSLRLFVEQYIAPLKSVKKREAYKNRHIVPPTGKLSKDVVIKMQTPQAYMLRVYTGPEAYSQKKAEVMNMLASILDQRYIKSIREEAGYAYSVSANGSQDFGLNPSYMLQVVCPFKPAARDSVLLLIDADIDRIAAEGVTAEEMDKVTKFELKELDDNQKKNDYWHGLISDRIVEGIDRGTGRADLIRSITSDDVKACARDLIRGRGNCVTLTLMPADLKE